MLDELNHRTFPSVRNMPEDHAKRSGGLALALAGVDDDQALLVGLGGHDLVARGLLLGHLRVMTLSIIHRSGLHLMNPHV